MDVFFLYSLKAGFLARMCFSIMGMLIKTNMTVIKTGPVRIHKRNPSEESANKKSPHQKVISPK